AATATGHAQQSWQYVPGPSGPSFLCPQLSQVRTLPTKSGSDRYRIWCGVGFWHGWQKAGRSMFCMTLGGLCPSTNVGEGGKSSQKLFPNGPQFQLGVRAGSLLPFWVWRRYLRQDDCERVFADVAGLTLDEL